MNQIIRTNGHETIILFFLIDGGIQQREYMNSETVCIDAFGLTSLNIQIINK